MENETKKTLVIKHMTNYKNWTLEEIYNSDKTYLYYLIHTHKTPPGLRRLVIQFLEKKQQQQHH